MPAFDVVLASGERRRVDVDNEAWPAEQAADVLAGFRALTGAPDVPGAAFRGHTIWRSPPSTAGTSRLRA
jgi:hypothetical protein